MRICPCFQGEVECSRAEYDKVVFVIGVNLVMRNLHNCYQEISAILEAPLQRYSTFPIKWEALKWEARRVFPLAIYSGRNGNSLKWEEISWILTKTRKLRFKTSLKFTAIYSGRNGNSLKWEATRNSLLKSERNGIPFDRECTVRHWVLVLESWIKYWLTWSPVRTR